VILNHRQEERLSSIVRHAWIPCRSSEEDERVDGRNAPALTSTCGSASMNIDSFSTLRSFLLLLLFLLVGHVLHFI